MEASRDEFENHRRMLEGFAYRMCGILADAQDIVQETHIRWCSADPSAIRNPRSWLITVCSRIALDMLKSARVRREKYVGVWLPEPYASTHEASANKCLQIDESISTALMVAMERLNPVERAAFLLHDIFGYSFAEVSEILEKSESACRKSASRARATVRDGRPRFSVSAETHRQLLDGFFEAVHSGDLSKLKAMLSESATLYADGGGQVNTAHEILRGSDSVAAFFLEVWRQNVPRRDSVRIESRWFNGAVGSLIYQNNALIVAISIEIEDRKIRSIYAQRNPAKLSSSQL